MFEELWRDDRAIEGLPIRLVIALVVGVASLSVMMNTIAGLNTMSVTELDVDPEPEVVGPGERTVELTVVDPQGSPVAGATVVVTGGTAGLEGSKTAETDANGTASVTIQPTLAANQAEGTVEIDVKPPASGGYSDRRANTDVLVVRGHSGSSGANANGDGAGENGTDGGNADAALARSLAGGA